VIATYDNHALLRDRAIPSVLAQDYPNFEIVVVGDEAPPETAEVIASFTDPRIRYFNLKHRGPYPQEPRARWHAAGIPPYNHGVQMAAGQWIAPQADDDAFRPQHLTSLLKLAREDELEMAYGKFVVHTRDGSPVEAGAFPPQHGEFGIQTCIYHAELRVFELELSDALFGLPGDPGWCQRLLRSGARIGCSTPSSPTTTRRCHGPRGKGMGEAVRASPHAGSDRDP